MTQHLVRVLFGLILFLFFLTMIFFVAIEMLASEENPRPPRPFAYLKRRLERLFERPPAQRFRFLDLPPEVRNMVYEHLSDRYWVTRRQFIRHQITRREKRRIRADAFLSANRQIYEEAMHVLVTRMRDVFSIRFYEQQTRDPPSTENPLDDSSQTIAGLRKNWHILRYTRTIGLVIFWRNYDWPERSEEGQEDSPGVMVLKRDIEKVCIFGLARMPNLRTIKVFFWGARGDSRDWTTIFPAKDRIAGLLRPLEVVRRGNPEVVVEMPEGCPISTAELANQQGDTDVNERMEGLRALEEGRRMMDGGSVAVNES